jgi:NTP pyrophosphatase (non-canonical NTP hydrolase)
MIMNIFPWRKERKRRQMAIRYIQEGNAEIERVFRELTELALEVAQMIQKNKEEQS